MPAPTTTAIALKDWKPILSLLESFTADRDIVPALKHFYFSGDSVRAFSGIQGAHWTTPWTMPGTAFAVPAAPLVQLVSSLDDQGFEEVTVGLTETGKSLSIRSNKFRGTLPVLQDLKDAPETFMFRDAPGAKKQLTVTKDFWTSLRRVMFTVGQDETKSQFRGVYWSSAGSFASADGFRVTVCMPDKKERVGCPVPGGLLIPDALLSRLGGRMSNIDAVALEGSLLWTFHDTGGGSIYSTLFEATFPINSVSERAKAMRDAVRKGAGTSAKLRGDAAMLALSLGRLLLFTDPPTWRMAATITGKGKTGRVKLEVFDTEGAAAAEETFEAEVTGPDTAFAINGKFFQDALGVGTTLFHPSGKLSTQVCFQDEDNGVEHLFPLLSQPSA